MTGLKALPKWQGKAFRADTGYRNTGKTAFDVVKFECTELGNFGDFEHLTEEMLNELHQYPASSIVWVTKTKKDAEYYGKVYEIDGDNARIITTDGDNGYLILQMKAR